MVDPDIKILNKSLNLKAVGAVIGIVLPITGSIVGGFGYAGEKFYNFAEQQTRLADAVMMLNNKIEDGLTREGKARDGVITNLREELRDVKTDLQSTKANANTAAIDAMGLETNFKNLEKSVDEIKSIVTQTDKITRSHDEDIRATRQAVAPRDDNPPRPRP
jgi:chromosome segregation ATPase